ncbi:hypothetical protein BS47DRAFT_1396177 [Hydnum rufescens UP504]|uniref:Uncharacterized protein n=1 Tax=Hydnum rufescens UP504 TaxID=1448309 RepID=A0A9P6AQN8_9AGAM|nr:hypothetical protein BS47DRAFT_1396177 [Hydnum rufescens UP504]
MKDGYFLVAPSSLVLLSCPILDVVNPSPSWKWIHQGDILGILHKPDAYLDVNSEELLKRVQAVALVVQKIMQGPLGEQDLAEGPAHHSKENNFPVEPEGPEDLWGPKTSEPPDPLMHSSKELESL